MADYHLSDREIIRLKQQHRKAQTKWEADRLKTVYLLGEGWVPKPSPISSIKMNTPFSPAFNITKTAAAINYYKTTTTVKNRS